MDNDAKFQRLRSLIENKSPEAIESLVSEHSQTLASFIRRRIHPKMRTQYETYDFQQTVWQALLEDLDRLGSFETEEQMKTHLFQIAKAKVIDAFRQMLGRQRKEVPNSSIVRDGESSYDPDSVASGDPTPSYVAGNREEYDRLIDRLPDKYRTIIPLLSNGHNFTEVANQIGVSERTIRRLFSSLGEGAAS